jgi:N-acyl amino acid synthase of PEP-CTERM/exosortase system
LEPIRFKKITDTIELQEAFRLRYKVYCLERGFERPEDYPWGLEWDEFDEHAMHFGAFLDGELLGTVRLILNSRLGFPIERYCEIKADELIARNRTGEISRLAVLKEFPQRNEDGPVYCDRAFRDGLHREIRESLWEDRRQAEIVTGLYTCLYRESKEIGLSQWLAAMTRGLSVLLKRMGVHFVPIGPETSYHGRRTPHLASIGALEKSVQELNPDLLRKVKGDGVRENIFLDQPQLR